MTVTTNTFVRRRVWAGRRSPLPSGTWLGVATVLGDGSGGVRQIVFNFIDQGNWSELASLESMSAEDTNLGGNTGLIFAAGFDRDVFLPVNRSWSFQVQQATIRSTMLLRDFQRKWLGGQKDQNTQVALQVEIGNVTGHTFSVVVGGYLWTPEALLLPGGPQVPPTALFGQ